MAPKTNAERVREHRHRMSELALWGLVFECAGAATAPLLQDHPDYVFPSERVAAAVRACMADNGFTHPPQGYGE